MKQTPQEELEEQIKKFISTAKIVKNVKSSRREVLERSSLHRIINTKEKADAFMKQLESL